MLCLADWVLIEDFGFFGGVGTDPNSMIPMALVFVAGYLAITRVPAAGDDEAASRAPAGRHGSPWSERLNADPTYALRSVAAGAIAIVLLGAAPMALASIDPNADPIIAEAVDGTPNAENIPAPPFTLVDQRGGGVARQPSGKTIALTFLDHVCTSDCPVIAQEFRLADGMLGADARHVELVAIDANPLYIAPDYLAAFDHQEDLEGTCRTGST